jgi:hypothetical protein
MARASGGAGSVADNEGLGVEIGVGDAVGDQARPGEAKSSRLRSLLWISRLDRESFAVGLVRQASRVSIDAPPRRD